MADILVWLIAALGAAGGTVLGRIWGLAEGIRAGRKEAERDALEDAVDGWSGAVRRCATVAMLAILPSGCSTMTGAGDAGCTSYAEARLARPPAETIAGIPPAWATWIADLDDRMTGTCR